MATRSEQHRYAEERIGPKKARRPARRARRARPGAPDVPRILESSRTRGQDIRVVHPPKRPWP